MLGGWATRSRAPVEERSTLPSRPPAVATPAPASPVSPEPETRPPPTYVVKRGDTLYKIALDNGLDYRELAAWDAIQNVNVLREGQSLRVTEPGEPAGTSNGVTPTPP